MATSTLTQDAETIQLYEDSIQPFKAVLRSLTKEQRRALRIMLSFPGTALLLKKELRVMQ